MPDRDICLTWKVLIAFMISSCYCHETTRQFAVSHDVSVLGSSSLACHRDTYVRSQLEAGAICAKWTDCRAITRPCYWCVCPNDPTLRMRQSTNLLLNTWMPRMLLQGKHLIFLWSCLITPVWVR